MWVKKSRKMGKHVPCDDSVRDARNLKRFYNFADVKQEFIYYMKATERFYQLSFSTNIDTIRKTEKYRLTHLRQRDSDNYKVLTCEAGEGKKWPKWEHKFIFFNNIFDRFGYMLDS